MNDCHPMRPPRPTPFIWQVELTNHCPYTCLGCPRPGMRRALGFMDWPTFQACVQAVRKVQKQARPLGLHHFGESLLHPALAKYVLFATELDVPTCLACNPDRLSPKTTVDLLQAGLRRITFSLDALDDVTLRQIRGPVASYARAERAILNFIEQRQRLDASCEVRIQMIAYKLNQPQWSAFLERWHNYPVYAYIKKFDHWTVPELAEQGAQLMQHACTAPFESVVVLWDGRVVACCHDLEGELVMGDISTGLEVLWHGEEYQEFRRQFSQHTLPQVHMCRDCAWWGQA